MMPKNVLLVFCLIVLPGGLCQAVEISNEAFRFELTLSDDEVCARLFDRVSNQTWTDDILIYYAERKDGKQATNHTGLESAELKLFEERIAVKGKLAGLDVRHTFELPADKPYLNEYLVLSNHTNKPLSLSDLQIKLQQKVTDAAGNVLSEYAGDHLIAVPFKHRADDPQGFDNDFSMHSLVTKKSWEYKISNYSPSRIPSEHRFSEGWAWMHKRHAFCVFKYNQEHMCYSVIATREQPKGTNLRFGGSSMISDMPSALVKIAPGESVNLGLTRYQTVSGYNQALYAFRDLLDEKSCHFPEDYNPPVHWNQLYNMVGAWNQRAEQYTRRRIEKEAARAKAYHCESLYLDPGWDTTFGSFIWGKEWLGPRSQFVRDMQTEYGLKVSLHCPMPPWSSSGSMGPSSIDEWPQAALRNGNDFSATTTVSAEEYGYLNLALLPDAQPRASSALQGHEIHKIAHLNDGWYSNSRSWIAANIPTWAEIDLGKVYTIGRIRLTNDYLEQFRDRYATELIVLVATEYNEDSNANVWKKVGDYKGQGYWKVKSFDFAPTSARWVRIQIDDGGELTPRLDEIEIFQARCASREQIATFKSSIKRGPKPKKRVTGSKLCMGSKQFLEEAERRLLANCADGVRFFMFDGTWWNGHCSDLSHGHPIPYRYEDHIETCVELAKRVHSEYPDVLIEMHDMLAGGSYSRLTPVYYKYPLPGSYDENWGFELMWQPLQDLKTGKSRALYYYNMACNIPLYLHVDLRNDNEHCIVLWWNASTCRHLGIGGTHSDPEVVSAQKKTMKKYRQLEEFYKRGRFYGINEEIHLHVLPEQNAFVVNIFNLSDKKRLIEGSIALKTLGLPPHLVYQRKGDFGRLDGGTGRLYVNEELEPWSTQLTVFRATDSGARTGKKKDVSANREILLSGSDWTIAPFEPG